MENKIVKCTRCRHIHPTELRVDVKGKDGWFHSSCPKCEGRITVEPTPKEYIAYLEKQQKQ